MIDNLLPHGMSSDALDCLEPSITLSPIGLMDTRFRTLNPESQPRLDAQTERNENAAQCGRIEGHSQMSKCRQSRASAKLSGHCYAAERGGPPRALPSGQLAAEETPRKCLFLHEKFDTAPARCQALCEKHLSTMKTAVEISCEDGSQTILPIRGIPQQ